MKKGTFDPKIIEHVIFDVDGTMYRKDLEYRPGKGSIQTAHDFFKYKAHEMLARGKNPLEIKKELAEEYQERARGGTLPSA